MKPKRGYSQWLVKQGVVPERVQVKTVDYDFKHMLHLYELREVLNGNTDSLYQAFTWDATPQGHNYWSTIRYKTRQLTEEDLAYLRGLEAAYLKYKG